MVYVPNFIVMDQDLTMKITVARVFNTTLYCLCMWHIMSKVGEKENPMLAKDKGSRQKLNIVVWDKTMSTDVFEVKCKGLMEKYGLVDYNWLYQLFE